MKSECRDFLEQVKECTALAVVESQTPVNRPIVSMNRLRSYLNEERLRSLLLYVICPPGYQDAVRARYLAVFSILLSIDKGPYLPTFMHHDNMADAALPFLTCDAWPEVSKTIFKEFYSAQWEFCPKELVSGQLHDIWLDENIVVPFKEKVVLKDGEDSVIFKVELFEEYNHLIPNDLNIPPTNIFILKSSRSDYAKLHNNEVEAYRTLLSYPSGRDAMQHMARFYGSWRQGDTRNILREYVGGGTLTTFFEQTQSPATMDDILEFWRNFIQFIKPIACIHHLPDPHNHHSYKAGLHNDIKPDNILVSEQEGHSPYSVSFKLADLGLAGFAGTDDSNKIQLRDVHGTKMYSAPEYFRGEADRSRQQSIMQARPAKDIWALACVISEAAVWTVFGPRGLVDYHRRRVEATNAISTLRNTGYSGCFHDTTKVLAVVEEMHREATQCRRANIDNIVGPFLTTVGAMMMQDPLQRPDAWKVYTDLGRAIDLATPRVHDPPTESPAANHHTRHSMPANITPNSANGLGLNLDESSMQSRSNIQRHESNPLPDRRSKFSGRPSPRSPSGASTTTHEETMNHHNRGLAPDTTHAWQRTPLPPIHSPVPQSDRSVGHTARPSASIPEVLEYIRKKKLVKSTTLPGEEWLKRLYGRDQIFLIDDSESMWQHWSDVRRVFEALAYLVKPMDKDGIELHFANSCEHNGREKDRKRLTRKFETVRPNGQCQMGFALDKILPEYYPDQRHNHTNKRSSYSPRVVEKPPVNIYILTDGVWSPGQHCLSTIQQHITSVVNHLVTTGKLQHVGIQFIRFGDDEIGKERLDILDNDGLKYYKVPIDIVDTEPFTGDVFKMILGSTDPSWDNEPST